MSVRITSLEEALSYVSGTKASSGDNELVATPGAGLRLVVVSFVIQNESAVATVMILRSATTPVWRVLGQNQGDGLTKDFPMGYEWKLAENEALNLNLDGANSCGYSVAYRLESV